MSTFFSTQESKFRFVSTCILLIVGVVGMFVLDNDLHQAISYSCAATAGLIHLLYLASDYDAPF